MLAFRQLQGFDGVPQLLQPHIVVIAQAAFPVAPQLAQRISHVAKHLMIACVHRMGGVASPRQLKLLKLLYSRHQNASQGQFS
ncbi:MAG: hypothetical protein GX650_01045 [Clostridiales bacterium]|nr:hypothetical protein [Clostridiales bacterium]